MTFRIVLTVLLSMRIAFRLAKIGEAKEADTPGFALFAAVINATLIYGVWNWL